MTAWQELAARLRFSAADTGQPEEPPPDPWETASAPAKVAKRISEGVFDTPVSPAHITLLTNAMHWGYGSGWGTLYGLVAGSARDAPGRSAAAAAGSDVAL